MLTLPIHQLNGSVKVAGDAVHPPLRAIQLLLSRPLNFLMCRSVNVPYRAKPHSMHSTTLPGTTKQPNALTGECVAVAVADLAGDAHARP